MSGGSIEQAREALALCVSSLPTGATFNIVGFGSSFTELFQGSQSFDDAHKAMALSHCKGLEADLGGTEILSPLRFISQTKPSVERPRQVFVITDGQVGNTAQVIEFVREDQAATGTRYFSFGIGSGVSNGLVTGIAEAGCGASEFIVSGERMQGKIMRQMNRALEPSIANVRVDFGALRLLSDVSPKNPKPLFTGSSSTPSSTPPPCPRVCPWW